MEIEVITPPPPPPPPPPSIELTITLDEGEVRELARLAWNGGHSAGDFLDSLYDTLYGMIPSRIINALPSGRVFRFEDDEED